jgi:hypothetical protein
MIRVGLCAGFGSTLVNEFTGIASYAFSVIRQDLYAQNNPGSCRAS